MLSSELSKKVLSRGDKVYTYLLNACWNSGKLELNCSSVRFQIARIYKHPVHTEENSALQIENIDTASGKAWAAWNESYVMRMAIQNVSQCIMNF